MPIEDKVEAYSVSVSQSSFRPETRVIRLQLESGGTAFIGFQGVRPPNFVQFVGSATNLFLTDDQFEDVHRLLQTESPVFFTALTFSASGSAPSTRSSISSQASRRAKGRRTRRAWRHSSAWPASRVPRDRRTRGSLG